MNRIELAVSDITREGTDAIVNAANESLLGGGGVDGAIHRAAGPSLREECRTLGGCLTGDAKLTGGHGLKARWVIHAVGPRWTGGGSHTEEALARTYRRVLEVAQNAGITTIAVPAISAGAFGFPKQLAARIALKTINESLARNPDLKQVRILVNDLDVWSAYRRELGLSAFPGIFWWQRFLSDIGFTR